MRGWRLRGGHVCGLGMLLGSIVAVGQAFAAPDFFPDVPNEVKFSPCEAKYVRVVILASSSSQPCIDELEIYGEDGKKNLALASLGAKATASSCLPGYPIHQIEHLNDGRYGNSHSWIAATQGKEWAQIELPAAAKVAKIVFSRDRDRQYRDRMPLWVQVQVSLDGQEWEMAAEAKAENLAARRSRRSGRFVPAVALPEPPTWEGLLHYAFLCERATWGRIDGGDHLSPLRVDRPAIPGGPPYWGRIARLDPLKRTLVQMDEMIGRLAAKGLDVAAERAELTRLRGRHEELSGTESPDAEAEESLYLDARLAKRRLMFRDPDLARLERILFVKRHP